MIWTKMCCGVISRLFPNTMCPAICQKLTISLNSFAWFYLPYVFLFYLHVVGYNANSNFATTNYILYNRCMVCCLVLPWVCVGVCVSFSFWHSISTALYVVYRDLYERILTSCLAWSFWPTRIFNANSLKHKRMLTFSFAPSSVSHLNAMLIWLMK